MIKQTESNARFLKYEPNAHAIRKDPGYRVLKRSEWNTTSRPLCLRKSQTQEQESIFKFEKFKMIYNITHRSGRPQEVSVAESRWEAEATQSTG